jgi:hypothetical protein
MNYYDFSVPVFINTLTALKGVLAKGEAFAKEQGIPETDMLALRFAPDMFPLVKQVQVATDNAKGAAARLTGKEAPKFEDTESNFAELYARIDKTVEYLKTFSPEDFKDAATITVTIPYFPGMHLVGDTYLRFYVHPNFFFHVTTAYDLLRNKGVQIGKADIAGNIPFIKD